MLRSHVEIGQKVTEKLKVDKDKTLTLEGTVIWIHPKGRFYRVRFDGPKGSCTESYFLAREKGDEYIFP